MTEKKMPRDEYQYGMPRKLLSRIAIKKLTGTALKVMLIIVENVYGWKKAKTKLSASYIVQALGITGNDKRLRSARVIVARALKELEEEDCILPYRNKFKTPNTIIIHPSIAIGSRESANPEVTSSVNSQVDNLSTPGLHKYNDIIEQQVVVKQTTPVFDVEASKDASIKADIDKLRKELSRKEVWLVQVTTGVYQNFREAEKVKKDIIQIKAELSKLGGLPPEAPSAAIQAKSGDGWDDWI